MPTLTAFQRGVGPGSCSSVRRISQQVVLAAGEFARIDLNAVGKAANAGLVSRQQLPDELFRRRADEPEVADHAAAAIEHHHERDRLHAVVEQRDLLLLAVVVDFELVFREIRNETTLRVRHGDVHSDGLRGRF